MIELYSGTPGSGKSYHSTERIYYQLRRGKSVIANYGINTKKIKKCGTFYLLSNEALTVPFLIDYAMQHHRIGKEHETLLVIDEAGIKFNSRDWQAKDRLVWLDFFSQHRKYGYDVILVAQADIMLDKQIRAFIEVENNHRLLKQCGWVGYVLRPLFAFVNIRTWYGNKMRLGAEYIRYSSRIAKLYDTMGAFSWDTILKQSPSLQKMLTQEKQLQKN